MAILFSSFLSLSFIFLCFVGYLSGLRYHLVFHCCAFPLCVLSLVEPSVICYAIMFIARFISFVVPLSPLWPTPMLSMCSVCGTFSIVRASRIRVLYSVHLLGEKEIIYFRFLTVAPTHWVNKRGSINGIDNTAQWTCADATAAIAFLIFSPQWLIIMNQSGGMELSQKWKKYCNGAASAGPFSISINCIIFLLNFAHLPDNYIASSQSTWFAYIVVCPVDNVHISIISHSHYRLDQKTTILFRFPIIKFSKKLIFCTILLRLTSRFFCIISIWLKFWIQKSGKKSSKIEPFELKANTFGVSKKLWKGNCFEMVYFAVILCWFSWEK